MSNIPILLDVFTYITSGFLVVLSQHAYGNFVELHMTAVVYSIASSSSAWEDAYQQLTGQVNR